jgi:GNAT superfamily N-acetyltransferase
VDKSDRPFGFLSAELFDGELHIWELAIHRDRQGQGAGRALLEAAFAHARCNGCTAVTLTTFRNVAWNEDLYRHMGFVTLEPEHTGDRLSLVLANERANGLPAKRRCAMRLEL